MISRSDPALRALERVLTELEKYAQREDLGHYGDPHNYEGQGIEYAVEQIRAALAAAEAAPLDVEHPGEPHEFSMTCTKCGRGGMVHLSLITSEQRVTILDPDTETAG